MTRDDIFNVIKANTYEVVVGARGKELKESDQLRDLGADSLEIVEVIARSIRQLGIRVPRTELMEVRTLGDLADTLERAVARNR